MFFGRCISCRAVLCRETPVRLKDRACDDCLREVRARGLHPRQTVVLQESNVVNLLPTTHLRLAST